MSDFDRIKEILPLRKTVLSLTGLKMNGPHLERCPFCGHHDCFSFKDSGFRCFSCDAKGDIFKFLERYEGITPKEALERAAELAGVALTPGQSQSRGGGSMKKDASVESPTIKDKIFAAAADYFHANAQHGGRAYFIEARKHTERTLGSLKAGWSDGKLLGHLRGLGFSEEDIVTSGLAVERVKPDGMRLDDLFFSGLAVYPHYSQGKIVHFTCKDPAGKYELQLPRKYRDESWLCYNQDALYKRGELIIVEGENDLMSLFDAGVHNVVALCGNPSDERFKRIVTYCANRHVYLCFDNDDGGRKYVRKFAAALSAEGAVVRIVDFHFSPSAGERPGVIAKDIDEYLRYFTGDRHREVQRLRTDAVDILTWEIRQASLLDGLEARHRHLKEHGVFKGVSGLTDLEQEIFVDKITRLGFTPKVVHAALETEEDLLQIIATYYASVGERNVKSHDLAEMIYKWFSQKGKFFHGKDGKAYLFYDKTLCEIGNNNRFNAMMERLTRLSAIEAPGKNVWYWLETFCVGRGAPIQVLSWIHTNHEANAVYLNLNSPGNTILKLSPGNPPELVANATNPDGVLLNSCPEIKPVRYRPGTKTREALGLLRQIVFDNLTCERTDCYLVLCWFISFLFLDFNEIKGFMKFEGDSGSGKSTAADLLYAIIYGEGKAGQATFAGVMRQSGMPLLVLDNLESANLTNNFKNVFLMARDGRGRAKSKSGTDSEVIKEEIKGLVIWTAIEPIPGSLSELMTGAFTVIFDHRFQKKGFIRIDAIKEAVNHRDVILSGLMDLAVTMILPNLKDRSRWLTLIETSYPNHNKKRANEFISLLALILEAVVEEIPFFPPGHIAAGQGEDAPTILRHWIKGQDALAAEIGVGSNSILNILDGIYREYEAAMREKALTPEPVKGLDVSCHVYTHPLYLVELARSVGEKRPVKVDGQDVEATVKTVQFEVKMPELHKAFSRYCREHGTRNPYESPMTLGKRIHNDIETLRKGGWELVGNKDGGLHNRTVRGDKIYRFRKELYYGV